MCPVVSAVVARWALLVGALVCQAACGRTGLEVGRDRWAAEDGDGGRRDEDDDEAAGGQTCQQVDFLFVIDNSGSMADNQSKLIGQYDAFIDGIQGTVDRIDSIHVGVVTTDAYAHNNSLCRQVGGLVVETGGPNSSRATCGPYAGGRNYMTDADDLEDAFPCAGRVGTDGSGAEASVTAAIAAISPPLTSPGQCNEGFLRSDALLVLVIITDEDADLDPLFAIQALTEAKGDEDIVLVVLANGPDSGCDVDGHGRIAYGLADLTNLFAHGFLGPICASDYGEVFTDAIAVVEAACPGG